MSDNNVEDDTGVATAEKGSSSECSDISIEKLNAEEPEVAEIKSTEDNDKVFFDGPKGASNILTIYSNNST